MNNEEDIVEGIDCSPDEVVEYCHTSRIDWQPTKKNKEFRFKAGLSIDEIINYVKSIRKEYYQYTIEDITPGHSGKMHVFKRLIEDKYWCYIKVKINKTKEDKFVLVVSFHEDERMI